MSEIQLRANLEEILRGTRRREQGNSNIQLGPGGLSGEDDGGFRDAGMETGNSQVGG